MFLSPIDEKRMLLDSDPALCLKCFNAGRLPPKAVHFASVPCRSERVSEDCEPILEVEHRDGELLDVLNTNQSLHCAPNLMLEVVESHVFR